MFRVNSFVELRDTDMVISVGGPMSDWKNKGLRVIDGATAFDHPDRTTLSYVLLVLQAHALQHYGLPINYEHPAVK